MTLKVKVMTPIFNTSWEYPWMLVWCKFGDSRPNLWRVQTTKFPRILSQNGKNNFEGQGQWPVFSITVITSRINVGANSLIPAQICGKLSHGQDKVYRQTDHCQWQYPFGLKGQGVNITCQNFKTYWYPLTEVKTTPWSLWGCGVKCMQKVPKSHSWPNLLHDQSDKMTLLKLI